MTPTPGDPSATSLASFTLHVTFLATSDEEAIDEATRMVMHLCDEHPTVGEDDWDVSDTVDWAEILDRGEELLAAHTGQTDAGTR